MGFPCRCYVPAVLGREAGEPESCLLPPFPLQLPGALCVRLSIPGHSMQHSDTLCCDLPLCRGCRGLVPMGDAPVHPDPTMCSLQLWCHQHRLLMATLAVSSLSHCCTLSVCEEGFANLCRHRQGCTACSLPACCPCITACPCTHVPGPEQHLPAGVLQTHLPPTRPLCNRMQKNAFKFHFNSSCKSYFMLKLQTHSLLS